MLTNEQKSLLKRAQRQAALGDDEYRAALELIAGVRSSTDARIGDSHMDVLMSYFEAIYWQKVASNQCKNPDQLVRSGMKRQWLPFLAPDYWKNKNPKACNSRDRFVEGNLAESIAQAEQALFDMGFNTAYVAAIRLNVTQGRGTTRDLLNYKAALERTAKSKAKKMEENPF